MSEEIKEILDRLDYEEWEVDLYKVPITWCELYDIRNYITNLQQKVEQLEKENEILKENAIHNDKVVDKVNWENMLLKRNCNIGTDNLTFYRDKYKQLENIRKESIEYIKDKQKMQYKFALSHIECDDLLNILNKGSDKEW